MAWLNILNTIILAGTAFIVWKYTQAAQEGNELRIRPILNLYLREDGFVLKNIGEGTAYNITIEEIKIEDYTYKFHFKQANIILEPNGDEKLMHFLVSQGSSIFSEDLSKLKDFFHAKSFKKDVIEKAEKYFATFLFHYENINGKIFYSVFKLYTTHPLTGEFIIELIKSGKGECTIKKAQKLCQSKEKMESTY